jgi:protein ImuB
MSFACIFVPDFFTEALLRAEPGLRSQAVAVLEGKPPLQTIAAVNQKARHAGISVGMTKLQVEGCPSVALRDRSPLQETAAHQALLDCAQSFSPRIEGTAPDTVLLDLSGLNLLFGSLPKIARDIFRRASNVGLQTNVAVASTLEAALLAARGFSGVTVAPEGKESELLSSLPVEVLFENETGLEESQFLETFKQWGIRKFRDLVALPEVALSERLGQRGLELRQKACGLGGRTLVPCDPPPMFEEVMELEFSLVLLEPLAFVLSRMLDQLCARLQARALAAHKLCLELTLENTRQCNTEIGNALFLRTIHLPVPLLDAKLFLKLLQLDLKSYPPGAPILKVHLQIEPANPRPAQNGLFIPCSPEPEKLELTLARISSIVGEGRAGSPELLDTHRPDAFLMRRFTPATGTAGNSPASESSVTALRIFRPPIAVTVSYENGRLSHISSKKQIAGDVLWVAGPWRSSGDWWEKDAWIRDEWDIAVQDKTSITLYRLIHDLIRGRWLLDGSYD